MADDRWNEDRDSDEPLRGDVQRDQDGRRERLVSQARTWTQDWAQYEETRYRPFGETGPISTRSGGYTAEGRPYALGGRYEDLPPEDRAFESPQQRIHRSDEARVWWKRAQDELSSWFGDIDAARRRTALDRPTVPVSAGVGPRARPG